jgi:hypothetical protein
MSTSSGSRRRLVLGALGLLALALLLGLLWQLRRGPTGARGGAPAADAGVTARPAAAARPSRFAPPPADQLTLSGQVVDARGTPVADASVLLIGEPTRTTRSNAAGAFAFDGLWAGAYLVEAWSGTAAGGPVRAHLGRDTPRVVIRLFEAGQLTVTVLDAQHRTPVPKAAVELRAMGMTRNGVTVRAGATDAKGTVAFRGVQPSGYLVAAWARGYRHTVASLEPTSGLQWEATVTLSAGSEVQGRVVDHTGAPVEGALVWATPFAGAGGLQASRPPPFDFTPRTDAKGEVTLTAPAGRHRLMVDHPRYVLGFSEPFDVDGTAPVRGVVAILDRGGVIAGTVVTARQVPVPRARVRVAPTDAQTGGGSVREVVCDAAGRFEVAGLPLTAMELAAFADGATSETFAVDLAARADQRSVVVPLAFDGVVGGLVVGSSGTPVADAHVQCVGYAREAVGLRDAVTETTDGAGRFACRGLRPGEYRVTAIPPGSNNMVHAAMRGVGADAQTGQEDLRLVIRDDGSISGRVQLSDGRPAQQFRLQLVSGLRGRLFVTEDGRFSVDGLAPRTYQLVVTVASLAPRRLVVTVPERANADLGVITIDKDAPPEPPPPDFPAAHEYVPPASPLPPMPSGPSGEPGASGAAGKAPAPGATGPSGAPRPGTTAPGHVPPDEVKPAPPPPGGAPTGASGASGRQPGSSAPPRP